MAIVDFPTTSAFQGAQFSLWVNTSERAYTGFFTGNRTTRSNLADRLGCMVTLPPVKNRVAAAAREAWLLSLRSTGDHVRFGMPHRASPLGTIGGETTVSANASAGARSVSIAGCLSRPNMILNSSFEADLNADGIADGWTAYSLGSVGTVTRNIVPGPYGGLAQGIRSIGLGSSSGDRVGIQYGGAFLYVAGGAPYSLSVVKRDFGVPTTLLINWFTSSLTFISTSSSTFSSAGTTWVPLQMSAVAPANATRCTFYFMVIGYPGVPGDLAFEIDNAQFEQASAATSYAGRATLAAGDFIGVGGNLLQSAGAVALDSGAMTVPLTTPLQKAITSGAAVTLAGPTGVWELEDPGVQLDYTAPIIQGPLVLRFRQVPQ